MTIPAEASSHLFARCTFKKKLQGLSKIVPGVFDTVPLTGNIQLRTQRHIAIAFSFDNGCQFHRKPSSEKPGNKAISFLRTTLSLILLQ
jgi:hypothetical protein